MVYRHTSVAMNIIYNTFTSQTAVYIMSSQVAARLQTIHLLYTMIMEVLSFSIGVQVRSVSNVSQAITHGFHVLQRCSMIMLVLVHAFADCSHLTIVAFQQFCMFFTLHRACSVSCVAFGSSSLWTCRLCLLHVGRPQLAL